VATPYLSEIKILPFTFVPRKWASCDGQVLPIGQNQALFALIGTTYGGNGVTTFALPDLQGRVPLHVGIGFALGQKNDIKAQTVTLTANQVQSHAHPASGTSAAGDSPIPTGNFLGAATSAYGPLGTSATTLQPATIPSAGGNQAHDNMQPYLVLNFCIALAGIYPTQN
jgi:microcystin-dependent protein